jgi:G3E family GTPase
VIGTLVLADATRITTQADDRCVGDTVRQQLADANCLLLTRQDLATAQELEASTEDLARQAPAARLLPLTAQTLSIDQLQGWPAAEAATPVTPRESPADTPWTPRRIGPLPVPPPSPVASRSITLPDDIDLPALADWLTDPAHGVLRAKALARDARGHRPIAAGGRWSLGRHTRQRERRRAAGADRVARPDRAARPGPTQRIGARQLTSRPCPHAHHHRRLAR